MVSFGFDFHERDSPPPSEDLAAAWRQYIEPCIEAFGVNRCMFESNFPPDKQSCGYYRVVERLQAHHRQCLEQSKRRALYSGTAAKVYRLNSAARDIAISSYGLVRSDLPAIAASQRARALDRATTGLEHSACPLRCHRKSCQAQRAQQGGTCHGNHPSERSAILHIPGPRRRNGTRPKGGGPASTAWLMAATSGRRCATACPTLPRSAH